MTTQSNKRSDQISSDQAMIAGIQKFLAQLASVTAGSQTMTPAAIVQLFQARIQLAQAVQTARAAFKAAVQANLGERANTAAFVRSLRRVIVGMFEQSPDTLAVFNLTAPKVAKVSVATKAKAVALNKATRVARNTMGSVQKKDIKGTLPEATTAPAAEAPAANSGAAPAPAVSAPKPAT